MAMSQSTLSYGSGDPLISGDLWASTGVTTFIRTLDDQVARLITKALVPIRQRMLSELLNDAEWAPYAKLVVLDFARDEFVVNLKGTDEQNDEMMVLEYGDGPSGIRPTGMLRRQIITATRALESAIELELSV